MKVIKNKCDNIKKEIYLILKNCIRFETIENKQIVKKGLSKVNKYLERLPKEEANDIAGFIEEVIKPILYNPHYFDFLQRKEFGTFDEEGRFEINSEESLDMMIFLMYQRVLELNGTLDSFAFSNLVTV